MVCNSLISYSLDVAKVPFVSYRVEKRHITSLILGPYNNLRVQHDAYVVHWSSLLVLNYVQIISSISSCYYLFTDSTDKMIDLALASSNSSFNVSGKIFSIQNLVSY